MLHSSEFSCTGSPSANAEALREDEQPQDESNSDDWLNRAQYIGSQIATLLR